MVITFHTEVRFKPAHMETPEIEPRKISRNSNGHNFSLGCPIWGHKISRRSKLNNGSSREMQMVITFHSNVRFGDIIYRDAEIEQRKLSENSNCHNFSHGCPIGGHKISRLSKLNDGSSREIAMLITFNTNVYFRRIIYRDARN